MSSGHRSRWALRISGGWVLGALGLMIVAAPFLSSDGTGKLVESVLLTLVLCCAVLAVGGTRRVFMIALGMASVAIAGRWANHLSPGAAPAEIYLATATATGAFVTAQYLRFIMRARRVDADVLCTGLAGFVMLAVLWAFAYAMVERLVPGSFEYTAGAAAERKMEGYIPIYFSLVTICTVGFGDIVPVTGAARLLAMLEGAAGVMFIAVMLARLVSLYSVEQEQKAK